MATMTLSITSGAGTTSKTVTFSGADATRIMQAFQVEVPAATQQDLTDNLTYYLKRRILEMVVRKETVTPTIDLT